MIRTTTLKNKISGMRIKFAFLSIVLLFSMNNSVYATGVITDLTKSISEKKIFKAIDKNEFELATQNLNKHIKKYDEDLITFYLGYLIFSDNKNKKYSLENSFINSHKGLEKYKSLNYKQKAKYNQKFYINEKVLNAKTKMLQNNLLIKYGNNLDSINILLNLLQNAKIENKTFVEKVRLKEDILIFNEVIKSNKIENYSQFINETKNVELQNIAKFKIDSLKFNRILELSNNENFTTFRYDYPNSGIKNNVVHKVNNYETISENENYNNSIKTNQSWNLITNNHEGIVTDIRSGCQLFINKNNFQIIWNGACVDGYVDGKGECKFFKDNTLIFTYVGNFSKGTILYPLSILYPDGSKYFGVLKDGKYFQGDFTFVDGSIYSGNWIDGKLNGYGTSTSKNGSVYVGEWKDNKKNGKGSLTLADGSKYVGVWKDDTLSGLITFYFVDGSIFTGVMENDIINGYGTCTYPNGSVYTGNWKNGEIYGKGRLIKTNGESYYGEWRNGKENGQGTYTNTNGSNYTGEWLDGKRNGFGTNTYSDGTKYIGEWSNNAMNGQGTIIYKIGDRYAGEWKNGLKRGHGTYTFGDSCKYIGIWNAGRMIHGKVYTSKGQIAYDGDMENYYR